MIKFILLNGPPHSGKDTVAKMVIDNLSDSEYLVSHEKFSAPLKEAFAAMMEGDINNFVVEHYEDHKEEVVPCLGVSFRQWQIDFSEKFMKPLYGNDIFGRLLVQRINDSRLDADDDWIFVISDCGFQIEVDHILKSIPKEDIFLIRLHREGTSFDGDSRSYVAAPNCEELDFRNNASLNILEELICEHVNTWLAP
jgi:hypothetical protein